MDRAGTKGAEVREIAARRPDHRLLLHYSAAAIRMDLPTPPSSSDTNASEPLGNPANADPVWSIVANVLLDRPFGPGGVEVQSGTKHFSPGAKVYVIKFYWGMGGESLTVIGRHRKSKRFICIDMRAKDLANWRVAMAYNPWVVSRIREFGELRNVWVKEESKWVKGAETEYARQRAEEIVAQYKRGGAIVQPYGHGLPAAE